MRELHFSKRLTVPHSSMKIGAALWRERYFQSLNRVDSSNMMQPVKLYRQLLPNNLSMATTRRVLLEVTPLKIKITNSLSKTFHISNNKSNLCSRDLFLENKRFLRVCKNQYLSMTMRCLLNNSSNGKIWYNSIRISNQETIFRTAFCRSLIINHTTIFHKEHTRCC